MTNREFTAWGFKVCLTHKSIKRCYLRVLPERQLVSVTAPYGVGEDEVRAFMARHILWLRAKMCHAASPAAAKSSPSYRDGATIPLWGSELTLRLKDTPPHFQAYVAGQELVLHLPRALSQPQQVAALVRTFYADELRRALNDIWEHLEQRVGVKAQGYTVRDMKTRWGACNTRSHHISINLQLVKHPRECLSYIVVHELTHILVRNHNEQFYALVANAMPEWRKVKRLLDASARLHPPRQSI